MILTSTQFNRPQYTKRMLESLGRVRGIGNYDLIVSLDRDEDGINEEVYCLLRQVDFCKVKINLAKDRLTCNLNTLKALYLGLQEDVDVFHIEDDICLAPDSLEYIFNVRNYRRDVWDKSFSISLFNRTRKEEVGDEYFTVLERPVFVPWGFVLRKEIFEKALFSNCFCPAASHYLSWDVRMDTLRKSLGLTEIFPKFSRAINIGDTGVHMRPEFWKENVEIDYWAGNVEYHEGKWDIQIPQNETE